MKTAHSSISGILARLQRVDSGCIIWLGPKNRKGYGTTRFQGDNWLVHRLIWTWVHGVIPEGLFVCHSCDNPPCSNIQHLFLGTPSDNTTDAAQKGRMQQQQQKAPTTCLPRAITDQEAGRSVTVLREVVVSIQPTSLRPLTFNETQRKIVKIKGGLGPPPRPYYGK